jgi:hypothetical protein
MVGTIIILFKQVINCCINIMDSTRHDHLKVMTLDTCNTRIYAQPDIEKTTYHVDLERWTNVGIQFFDHDLVRI